MLQEFNFSSLVAHSPLTENFVIFQFQARKRPVELKQKIKANQFSTINPEIKMWQTEIVSKISKNKQTNKQINIKQSSCKKINRKTNLKKTNFSLQHLNLSQLSALPIQIWVLWRRFRTRWWQWWHFRSSPFSSIHFIRNPACFHYFLLNRVNVTECSSYTYIHRFI